MLVVVPAGVAGLSAGAGALRGVDDVMAPCREEAAVGVGSPTEAEGDASGEPETAGPEAEGEGAGDEAEGEEEGGVSVGDGLGCLPCPCPATAAGESGPTASSGTLRADG